LKDILQDKQISKVFFDVRNDSDALYAHFGVALQGIEDVQLIGSAPRKTTASRKFLNGLTKCVENNLFMSFGGSGLASWKLAKENDERLFKAEHGGSYETLNQRPIPQDLIAYCAGDVQHLHELRNRFWTEQTSRWRELVGEESRKRVMASQSPEYQPHCSHKLLSPWSKEHNKLLNQWSYDVSPRLSDDHWDWDDDATSWRDCIYDCDIGYYSN
jgi:exonuclease 3'-5' domain-containing protein 1